MKKLFEGIYSQGNRIYTVNSVPGKRVYGEELVSDGGKEYRTWDSTRSKLSAAIKNGLSTVPIRGGDKILYLGAATGTTPSHISDIVGEEGVVYCIEFSERAVRELLNVCNLRVNMIPMHTDARKLDYSIETVDVVYCDIAQPDQTPIAIRNAKKFLKDRGYIFLVVKSRSIDVVKDPKRVYKEEIRKLKEDNFEIVDWNTLDPYEKDHAMILARPK